MSKFSLLNFRDFIAENKNFCECWTLMREKFLRRFHNGDFIVWCKDAMRQKNWDEATKRWALMREKFPKRPEGYVGGVNALKESENFEAADALALEGLEKFPEAASLYMEYGDIAMRQKNWSEAVKRWAVGRAKFPEQAPGYFCGAAALKMLGDFAVADALILDGLKKFPTSYNMYIEYGDIAMHQKDWSEAVKRWTLMREKCPEHPYGYFSGVAALKEQGEFETADALALEGLEKFPKESRLYIEYGDIAMRQRNWAEAVKRWTLGYEKFPDQLEAYLMRGREKLILEQCRAFFEAGKYAEMETLCLTNFEHFSDSEELLFEYVKVAQHLGHVEEALSRILTINGNIESAGKWLLAGLLYSVLSNMEEAEACLVKAISLFPIASAPPPLFFELAKAIKLSPVPSNEKDALVALAKQAGNRKDFSRALKYYDIIIAKYPKHRSAYISAANECFSRGEIEHAIKFCRDGLEKVSSKHHPRLLYKLSIYYAALKSPENSRKAWQTLLYLIRKFPNEAKTENFFATVENIFKYFVSFSKNFSFIKKDCLEILKIFFEEPLRIDTIPHWFSFIVWMRGKFAKFRNVLLSSDLSNIPPDSPMMLFTEEYPDTIFYIFDKIIDRTNDIFILSFYYFLIDKQIVSSYVHFKLFSKGISNISNVHLLYKMIWLMDIIDHATCIEIEEKIIRTFIKEIDKYREVYLLCFRKESKNNLMEKCSSLPSHTGSKNLKIAVCVSGQLRHFVQTKENWDNILCLEKYDSKFFVHTWKNTGRKFPIYKHADRCFSGEFCRAYKRAVFDHDEKLWMKQYYPNLYELCTNGLIINEDELMDLYQTQFVRIEDDFCEPFASFSNQKKMYYKIWACNSLIKESGIDFDLVIRIRPDLLIPQKIKLDLNEIYDISKKEGAVFVNDIAPAFAPRYNINLHDVFAIGVPPVMDVYANAYVDRESMAQMGMFDCPTDFISHGTLTYQLFSHGVKMINLNMTHSLKSLDPLDVVDIHAAIQKDVSERTFSIPSDTSFLSACEEDLANITQGMG